MLDSDSIRDECKDKGEVEISTIGTTEEVIPPDKIGVGADCLWIYQDLVDNTERIADFRSRWLIRRHHQSGLHLPCRYITPSARRISSASLSGDERSLHESKASAICGTIRGAVVDVFLYLGGELPVPASFELWGRAKM